MAENTLDADASLEGARLAVPQHVVHRAFPTETVVLNLQTGKYHGLNPTAGEMLDELARRGTVAAVAAELAERHELPREEVEEDVRRLCTALLERGLLEVDEAER